MDRREALKKLSVGGAVAAGGSIVLSSTNVAYAMSGQPPTTAQFTIGAGSSTSLASVRVILPVTPGCTPTGWAWTLNSWSVSQGNSATVRVQGSSMLEVLTLLKSKHGWGPGDWVRVTVIVSWDCGGDVSYSSGQLNY